MPTLEEVIDKLKKLRRVLDRLRKRECGTIEDAGTSFPHSVTLSRFKPTDDITVVANGWSDDGSLHPILVKTDIERGGDGDVITLILTPHDSAGTALTGGEMIHVSWIAMA